MDLDFMNALDALKSGRRVTRAHYEGCYLAIAKNVTGRVHFTDSHTFRESSIPDNVAVQTITLRYAAHIVFVMPDGACMAWLPTPMDLMAEDWTVLD